MLSSGEGYTEMPEEYIADAGILQVKMPAYGAMVLHHRARININDARVRQRKSQSVLPLGSRLAFCIVFYELFFCNVFQTLIHDGCHMAVCQGVVNGFSVSSKFDQ